MATQSSKAPSAGYCGILGLSVSNLETSNGSLWVVVRATAGNTHVWEVSTAWDRATRTQDEVKVQLGIHSDVGAFTPQFYVASSSIYGVTAIAKRMAIGDWEHSPKSAEVAMMNILHLDKNTFWYLGGNPTTSSGIIFPSGQKVPLVVANGSLLLQGNDLYYSPDTCAFSFEEGFKYLGKYYYSPEYSVDPKYSAYRALAANVFVRTRHKK